MDDLLILGGGASGLSLGVLTGAPILESHSTPGGHSLSTYVDGYTFDRGPHIMFSRNQLVLQCMIESLGNNVHQCVRNNKVSIKNQLLKYPIENDLGSLPKSELISCVTDYVNAQIDNARETQSPKDLADWFEKTFGKALTELYFRPYNEKVWKTRLEDLSMLWAERIPSPPVVDVIKSALGESTEGYLHQLYYHYPRVGGYAALMNAWASGIDSNRLSLNTKVERIMPQRNQVQVQTNNGNFVARQVVSTLPLSHLPNIVDGIPTSVSQSISRLRTNATVLVTFAFEGVDHNQWTAVYIAESEFLPNRISYPSVFSPENAPKGHFLIQSEIIVPHLADIEHLDNDELVRHTYEGLKERGLIPEGASLVKTYIERYELAYVVYTNGYEKDLQVVKSWAEEIGILLHGRFGSHNYLNVDGCLEQSISLCRKLGFSLSDSEILDRFKKLGVRS